MLYVHHPDCEMHDPRAQSPEHPDDPARLVAIETAVAGAQLDLRRCLAPAATTAELELVHDPDHVQTLLALSASGGGRLDQDTFVGESSFLAAAHAAGGACRMVREMVAGGAPAGFCAVRPAGHHADRNQAMGFCLFNNVAIGAQLAISELGLQRVMIVDWDVHHGNGTAEIFRQRPDVLVAGIHQQGLFPGTGALSDTGSGLGRGFTVNLPVPAGSDDEVWLSLIEHLIVPIGLEFQPELVLISAGFDAHERDPLGGCRLQSDSFAQMACHIRQMATALHAPVGAVLEGGYELQALAESVPLTIAALAGAGEAESIAPDQIVTPRLASHLAHRWTL
jgi:acetoin utilization deacetylase AcuC-like enzyme